MRPRIRNSLRQRDLTTTEARRPRRLRFVDLRPCNGLTGDQLTVDPVRLPCALATIRSLGVTRRCASRCRESRTKRTYGNVAGTRGFLRIVEIPADQVGSVR